MSPENKKTVAEEIFRNIGMTREQYDVFKGIVADLDLDIPKKEPTWEELFE